MTIEQRKAYSALCDRCLNPELDDHDREPLFDSKEEAWDYLQDHDWVNINGEIVCSRCIEEESVGEADD